MIINVLEYLERTLENIADPAKAAFISDDTALSFRELSDISRACGSYLNRHGIRKSPVVVFMQKSPEMIAAFLGVVYGGNYYVPLDAEMPAFRIQLIMETVNPPLIICDEKTAALILEWGLSYPTIMYKEISNHPVDDEALADIRNRAIDADVLYVVFTSGSTGIPKGVVASHRSVIDYIENLSKVLNIGSETVFGNQSPLYLDACLKEIYPTIKFGASTYLIPQHLFMFPVRLIEYLNAHSINTICWVASALGMVSGLGALKVVTPQTLHTIAFGSEVFPIKHFNCWRETLPDARFIHLYGPTEATGMSCFYEAKRTYQPEESIPIGYPFQNTEIILLDENDQISEDGQQGEICIRGAGLALGYYRDAEKSAASFVQNPLSTFPDTIYRTGDLGYRGPEGELYFISRRDHQIKHMGYRIELAEIELVAAKCNGVEIACAVFDKTESHIILYYMPNYTKKSDVQAYLKSSLPRYMLPHTVIPLDSLPLTPGGKIDRIGLLEKHRQRIRNPE